MVYQGTEKMLTKQGLNLTDEKGAPAEGRANPLKRASTPNSDKSTPAKINMDLKFECKGLECSYDLESEKMQIPRMYTMVQLRDLFYGMLNQSQM